MIKSSPFASTDQHQEKLVLKVVYCNAVDCMVLIVLGIVYATLTIVSILHSTHACYAATAARAWSDHE